ncbi:MAG: hypothetical protein HY819_24045 [Acidobacteria bacterium]|nr:hypothetical protein [Acidobacteriota bacterium]
MITLALPVEDQQPEDWQDFRFALKEYQLTISKISKFSKDLVKVEINTSSEEQTQIVVDLMQLCFTKYYSV